MSKLQADEVRAALREIIAESKEKKRNFTETLELQIGLKGYDPSKDKRFTGNLFNKQHLFFVVHFCFRDTTV